VVKQVRVMHNVLVLAMICFGLLWLVRGHIPSSPGAVAIGALLGLGYGGFYWSRLARRVARRDRRFARNKIFVSFLSVFELAVLAAASSHVILIVLGLLLLVGMVLGLITGHWWIVVAGGFGLSTAATLAVGVLRYEHRHGPLHYQYDSRAWAGGEGLLYQTGQVIEPLTPAGRVMVNGESWNAVALGGEAIANGECVEVISRKGLTLYVDRLPV